MRNKYNIIIEKILIYIPFLTFLLYTNVHLAFAMQSNSAFVSSIINFFNKLYMKSPYIFLLIALILTIYTLINGSKKQKLITIATIIGCLLMCYNLTTESIKIGFLTVLLFVSSYLIGILFTLSIYIYIKKNNINDIKKKIITVAKSIVIYVGIMFFLAAISNTNQYSYTYVEQGVTAWIRSTNALGHALVFLLPLFMVCYIRDKKNNYLFYIIVIAILDLLIGTKACYYGLLSTSFITTLYLFIDFIKTKKHHYFKLLSLTILSVLIVLVSSNLYVSNNIKKSIKNNTNEQGKIDIVNFVISDRDSNVDIIKPAFNDSNTFTKMFGLGLYYPRFDFSYVEFDLLDNLYLRGVYGLVLYVTFFGIIVINIFKGVFNNIKKHFDIDYLSMLLTLAYIGFSSLFVGHVVFNLMTLTVAIMLMLYYIFIIDKRIETKIELLKEEASKIELSKKETSKKKYKKRKK